MPPLLPLSLVHRERRRGDIGSPSSSSSARSPHGRTAPRIFVDSPTPPVHDRSGAGRAQAGGEQQVSECLERLRLEFGRAENKDTYQAASAAVQRLLDSHAHVERSGEGDTPERRTSDAVYRECLALTKGVASPWGVRFAAWTLQTIAELRPRVLVASAAAVGSVCLPAVLAAATRDDDMLYVLDSIDVALQAMQQAIADGETLAFVGSAGGGGGGGGGGGSAGEELYPRYLYPLATPLLAALASHGVQQGWAALGLAQVLKSSDVLLAGCERTVVAPCNGEFEDVLRPLYVVATEMFVNLEARVHGQALCPVLRLFSAALEAALVVSAYHADLYAVEDFFDVPQRRLIECAVAYTGHASWKVRHDALLVLRVLTCGGVGSRWRLAGGSGGPSGEALSAQLSTHIASLSRTDKIATVRALAKTLLPDLAPVGRFVHEKSRPQQQQPSPTKQPQQQQQQQRHNSSPREASPQPPPPPPPPPPLESPPRRPPSPQQNAAATAASPSSPAAASPHGPGLRCSACAHAALARDDVFCAYCGARLETATVVVGVAAAAAAEEERPEPPLRAAPLELSTLDKVALLLLDPQSLDVLALREHLLRVGNEDVHRVVLNIARRVGWSNEKGAKHALIDAFLTACSVLLDRFVPRFSATHLRCLESVC